MLKLANNIHFDISSTIHTRGVLQRPTFRRMRRMALFCTALASAAILQPAPAMANGNGEVRLWNQRAAVTLTNPTTAGTPGAGFPPPSALIHIAIVQGAVYDAVNAIKGGHEPYLPGLKAPTSASKGAAAATAAYHTLAGLIDQAPTLSAEVKFSIRTRLHDEYLSSLAGIPDGQAKEKGVEVGAAAAAAMLANRMGDGRFGAPGFPVGSAPGEWRPVPPAFLNDPGAWVRSVRPFTLPAPETFHTSGPSALTSDQYAAEFNEVKTLGRATDSSRTPAQTQLANWSAAHPVPMLYSAMRQVADAKGLTISEQARFHAMTSMAAADSVINCFAEKAHWNFWRPTTAIQLADTDGNPATEVDPNWTSLLAVPPYSDEPSGANCVVSGAMHSAKAFFGSDSASFDIVSSGPAGTTGLGSTRSYTRFTDVVTDMIEARILSGLHFRRADVNGALLGRQVAEYVDANFFNCGPPGQCRQEGRE